MPLTKKQAAAPAPAAKKTGKKAAQDNRYNAFKTFEGEQYTGMYVGCGHNQYYGKANGKRPMDVTLNDLHMGALKGTPRGWRMGQIKAQSFVNTIADAIFATAEK